MTINQEFTATKKRVRIFIYEFDGYFDGDPSLEEKADYANNEEEGFFLILASVMVVISLLLLGIDLVLSPVTGVKPLSERKNLTPPKKEPIGGTDNMTDGGDRLFVGGRTGNGLEGRRYRTDRGRDVSKVPQQFRSTGGNQARHRSRVSLETSFTNSSILRPREYWL